MFALPPLPYQLDALEPYMGHRALELHYDVLHRKYVDKVNVLTPTDWEVDDLIEVIEFAGEADLLDLRDAALQAWNHEFFWHSMRPANDLVGTGDGPFGLLVKRNFGSMGALREAFVEMGMTQFGSGWVWLCVCSEQNLVIKVTSNADNPMFWTDRKFPVLVCDLWEHSYYPDYGPDRAHYLATWFDMLGNFEYAAQNTRRVLQMMSENQAWYPAQHANNQD